MSVDERRLRWNERHAEGDFEGEGPNPTLVAAVSSLPPGDALELAAGSGTNAVWLASQGWRVTAVDWSSVGLERARAKADKTGVRIELLERSLFEWTPPPSAFDLVAIVYLHLPEQERDPVYRAAAAALRPGGRLVIVGHDRQNAAEGFGGPPEDRLFTADEISRALRTADDTLEVERAEVIRQPAPPAHVPIDALIVMRRPPRTGRPERSKE